MIVGALALGAGGCGGDDDASGGATTSSSESPSTSEVGATTTAGDDGTSTSAAETSTSAPAESTTVPCEGTGGGTDAVTSPLPSGMMLLTDVEIEAARPCVDTVTLKFRPDVAEAPGFTLEYQDGPFSEAGSGAPVEVDGGAFLVLRMEPAAIADLSVETAPLTYEGPRDIAPDGTAHVVQMRLYDAFEGVVGWVIGIDGQQPFTVDTGTSPPSITISIG